MVVSSTSSEETGHQSRENNKQIEILLFIGKNNFSSFPLKRIFLSLKQRNIIF